MDHIGSLGCFSICQVRSGHPQAAPPVTHVPGERDVPNKNVQLLDMIQVARLIGQELGGLAARSPGEKMLDLPERQTACGSPMPPDGLSHGQALSAQVGGAAGPGGQPVFLQPRHSSWGAQPFSSRCTKDPV